MGWGRECLTELPGTPLWCRSALLRRRGPVLTLEDAERGARDLDLDDLERAGAARELARLENRAVFHGWPAVTAHRVAIRHNTDHDIISNANTALTR